jgi:hypothetical protein
MQTAGQDDQGDERHGDTLHEERARAALDRNRTVTSRYFEYKPTITELLKAVGVGQVIDRAALRQAHLNTRDVSHLRIQA